MVPSSFFLLRHQQPLHGLLRCLCAQHLPRTLVQQVLHLLQPVAGHGPEVGVLGEEVPNQPVGVLVGAPLPRGVGVGEVHHHVGLRAEKLVLGHLQAVVVGHGEPDLLRQLAQLPGEGLADLRGRSVLQGHDDQEAGAPLHDGANGALLPRPDDQVALPVPRDGAILHRGVALVV